jgi:hypothetical protein
LDLTETAVRRWVAQADIDAGRRDGLTTAEREELSRLRHENRVLREERDILKKSPCRLGGTTAGWKCAKWVHYCHAVWVNEVGLAEWCCVPDEKSLTGALSGTTVCRSRRGKHEEQNLCTLGARPTAQRGSAWT